MDEIKIEQIRELAKIPDNISMTHHSSYRCQERNIQFADIEKVLKYGEIIEQYPTGYPYPSCLTLGLTVSGRPLHVCCSLGEGKIFIITAYYPDPKEWENDYKTRKVVD